MNTETTQGKQKRSWKNLLLIPGFQGKITLFVLLAGGACLLLNAYLYYIYVVESYGFIFKFSKLPKDMMDSRYSDLFTFGMSLTIITLIVLMLISTWVLVLTHRAAGSIYHMKKVVDEARSGNTSVRVHLREKDHFQDFAVSLNQLLDSVDKKAGAKP